MAVKISRICTSIFALLLIAALVLIVLLLPIFKASAAESHPLLFCDSLGFKGRYHVRIFKTGENQYSGRIADVSSGHEKDVISGPVHISKELMKQGQPCQAHIKWMVDGPVGAKSPEVSYWRMHSENSLYLDEQAKLSWPMACPLNQDLEADLDRCGGIDPQPF